MKTIYLLAGNALSFTVEGDGRLIGTDNGNRPMTISSASIAVRPLTAGPMPSYWLDCTPVGLPSGLAATGRSPPFRAFS